MDIEFPSLAESQRDFHSKMKAAQFFLDHIKEIYRPDNKVSTIPDKLFYYVDAVIFELHAASQTLLQMINVKAGLNERADKVNWGSNFKSLLKQKNNDLFAWWEEFNIAPEFHVLESMRQYVSHRGGSFLQAEVTDDKKIVLLSIPIRFRYYQGKPELKPTGRSIELIAELTSIGSFLNSKYKELGTM